MNYFPQLRNDAFIQVPYSRSERYRTVLNSNGASITYRSQDFGAHHTKWSIQFQGLLDSERLVLDEFFASMEGRLRAFTFLDPLDNLLAWSEDFGEGVWHKDAGLVLTTEPDGTFGSNATRIANPASVEQRLYQTLPLTNMFYYTASVYTRAGQPTPINLYLGEPTSALASGRLVGTEWNRIVFRGETLSSHEQLLVGIGIPPHTEVFVRGVQCEPAAVPTIYKRTSGDSGIHATCRFDTDSLEWVSRGLNNNSVKLTIVTM